MQELIVKYLPWGLSTLSIIIQIELGNKKARAWIWHLLCQVLWITWILCSKQWGFVPLNICFWVIGVRNYIKWRKDEQ